MSVKGRYPPSLVPRAGLSSSSIEAEFALAADSWYTALETMESRISRPRRFDVPAQPVTGQLLDAVKALSQEHELGLLDRFVCSDVQLCKMAAREGLSVLNPEEASL